MDLGQISWVESPPLVSGDQQIYDLKTTNAKKDAAQNEIQYAQKAGRTVPFLAYLFRYADNPTDKDEVEKIATAFRTMSNEFSTMQRTTPLLSAKHAPVAAFYSKLPQELRDHPWPNIVESSPEGMIHAGLAMLREVHRATGFQTESALVLTTVKKHRVFGGRTRGGGAGNAGLAERCHGSCLQFQRPDARARRGEA